MQVNFKNRMLRFYMSNCKPELSINSLYSTLTTWSISCISLSIIIYTIFHLRRGESAMAYHPPPSPPPPPLPLLGIIGILFVYLVICYLLLDIIDESAEGEDLESREGRRNSGLSEEELQEAPCFQQTEIIIATSLCGICLDSFASKEVCRMFPDCKHVFHKHCIDLWLVRRPTCPICRTSFVGRSL